MAATLVQAKGGATTSTADGITITIDTPTAGNLLVIIHGLYWATAGGNKSESSGFTHRVVGGNSSGYVTINILDKIATGSESTSLVITHEGGRVVQNSGIFLEYSGMSSSPFISGSTGSGTASNSNVTSKTSGNSNTGAITDALILAGFGMTMNEGPYSNNAFTNSFTLGGIQQGISGQSQHRTVYATREVTSASTYSTSYSWTPATECNSCIAAYQISTTSVLEITVSEAVTVSESVTAHPAQLLVMRTESVTVGEFVVASVGSGNNTATMLISGTQADINATLATLQYTSDSGYTGADAMTMVSTNATNNVDTDTLSITVVPAAAASDYDVITLAEAPIHRRKVT